MKKQTRNTLIVAFLLILTMGTVLGATSSSTIDWNWLQKMLLNMSSDIQQLKTTTTQTQTTTNQIFTITTETQQSTAQIEQTTQEIQETVEETNDIVKQTRDYLTDEVFPAIKEDKAILKAIIDNEATAWNKLLEMQEELEKYNEQLAEGHAKLQDSDEQIIEQIIQQRQDIVTMKQQIEERLSQLSTQVLPSMVAIHEEITALQGKLGENSQETIAKLNMLEDEMLDLDSDIINIRTINDDRYSIINGKLDEIAESAGKTQEIITETNAIKKDITNVRQYLEGDIKTILENIDTTTQETNEEVKVVDQKLEGIRYYLEYVVYPEIDANKQKLEAIQARQEQVWNDLAYIKQKVDESSEEIKADRKDIDKLGQEFSQQLYSNQIIIKQMDLKVSELLDKMSTETLTKLDSIDKDSAEIKAMLGEIRSQNEGMATTQQEIVESIAQLKTDMAKIDLDLESISRYSASLVNLLDCKSNSEGDMCKKLAQLTNAVDEVNSDTEKLKQGQITIKNYLDGLNNTDNQISEGVKTMRFQFNCETAIPNDVCFRLTLIETYMKNFEKDSVTIKQYADGMEEMKLDMQGKLAKLIEDSENTLKESQMIREQVQNAQFMTQENFATLTTKIQDIQTGVNEITTSGVKLDFTTLLLLQNILERVDSSNTKIEEVQSYLKGEVIQKIEEVQQTVEETSQETQQAVEENTEEVIEAVEESQQEIMADIDNNTQEIIAEINQSTEQVVEQVQQSQEEVQQTVEETSEETQQIIEENTEEVKQEVSIDTQALSEQISQSKEEIITKVEFEANKTREELSKEIQSSTNLIIADLNKNSKKLDDLLQNWGDNTAGDIINSLQNNLEQTIELHDMIEAYNETEKLRYEESKGVINSIKEWIGIFENTATNNYNKIQENITILNKAVKETLTLNNQVLDAITANGEDDQLYDEIATLITQNAELINYAKELNITTKELMNKVTTMSTSIQSIDTQLDSLKQGWTTDSEQKVLGRINILETKIDYLNTTDKQSELKEIAEQIREELGFNGKTTSAYEMIVKLEDKLVEAENSIKVKIELEGLKTREELSAKINEETTKTLQEINENQIMLYELLNKVSNFSTSELQMVVENHRDNLLTLQAWLGQFNTTEQMRFEESKKLSEKIINLIGVQQTTENTRHQQIITQLNTMDDQVQETGQLANQILTQVGTEEREQLHDLIINLMDELSGVLANVGNYTNANEIRLFKGRNYVTITVQPTDNTPTKVFAELKEKIKTVEYYDANTKLWNVYNPAAPFGNTLKEINAGRTYWITMKGDARLTIN